MSIRSIDVLRVVLIFQISFYALAQEDNIRIGGNGDDSANNGFPTHFVALRPDYTFWRMATVLKSLIDSRSAEKRRSSRGIASRPEWKNGRPRRLLVDFGRFRF